MRSLFRSGFALSGVLLLLCNPAAANDSEATVGAGGLELKKSDHISMISEDLFISQSRVKIRYVFHNTDTADVKTTVAFPLPEYDPNGAGNEVWPKDFEVRVDDKPIHAKSQEKTSPSGAVQTTWYWDFAFPAQKDVVVEHSYKPGVGNSEYTNEDRRYCIDASTKTVIENRHREVDAALEKKGFEKSDPERNAPWSLPWSTYGHMEVSYILKTGANWQGPIKNFHLVIDKEHPLTVVSTCLSGLKKIGATQFEFKAANFVPKEDIAILFVNGTAASVKKGWSYLKDGGDPLKRTNK